MENPSGRWVTMRGAHVFLKDGQGGVDTNHTPTNIHAKPPSHAPGHENPVGGDTPKKVVLASSNAATPSGRRAAIKRASAEQGPDPMHAHKAAEDTSLVNHLRGGGGDYYDRQTRKYRTRS